MNNLLYTQDKQGNFNFPVEQVISKKSKQPLSLWENGVTLLGIFIVCAMVDFVSLLQIIDSLLLDAGFIRWTAIIGLVVGFDLIPIYLGRFWKKYSQGYEVNKPILQLGSGIFVLAVLSYSYLRLSYQHLTLSHLDATSTTVFGSSTNVSSSPDPLPLTVMLITLPLITSLSSFVISYLISNPLKDEINRKEEILSKLQDTISQLEAILVEYDNDVDYYQRLMLADQENYKISKQQLSEQTEYYRDYVRQRLKEHLGNPVDTGILSEPLEKWYEEEK